MELISKLNLNRESIGTDGDTNQSSTDTSQYVSDLVLIMFYSLLITAGIIRSSAPSRS